MFFQWVVCAAIWVISMFGDLMLKSPKFHPLAMLGGVMWATGNVLCSPLFLQLMVKTMLPLDTLRTLSVFSRLNIRTVLGVLQLGRQDKMS